MADANVAIPRYEAVLDFLYENQIKIIPRRGTNRKIIKGGPLESGRMFICADAHWINKNPIIIKTPSFLPNNPIDHKRRNVIRYKTPGITSKAKVVGVRSPCHRILPVPVAIVRIDNR